MSDYYEILGVARDASQDEIKRAYRRLARKLHPDVAGQESEEKFKELAVAYEVLSDPAKRQRYDMGGGEGGDFFSSMGFDASEIFNTFFGGMGASGPVPRGRRGQDTLAYLEVTLEEIAFGSTRELNLDTAVPCQRCEGSCCEPGSSPRTCTTCNGSGSVVRLAQTMLGRMQTTVPCSACAGHGTVIPNPCSECAGEGRVRSRKKIRVEVPAGVEQGTRVRLSGQGETGPGGGPAGDLYVEFQELRHATLRRRGDNVYTEVTIPMTSAALGTVIEIETLDGMQEVVIPAGTQPGTSVTLDGLGVGRLQRRGRGNLIVIIDVEVPTKLDVQQRELLEQLANLRGEERRQPPNESGVFGKIREKFAGN
ncbi:molecular chaperone DnaJ [Actinomycetaceae bacterium TAE3-ERU4]|nr:molecular chaperone DnaJ [Actinomycetaceae bacterium TAE3-ERU4]